MGNSMICSDIYAKYHVQKMLLGSLRFTFTPNGKRQIQVENFSE